jgi:protein TonB
MLASLGSGGSGARGEGSADGGYPAVLRRIRDEVMKNVTYPERARRMGWEGRVIISFMIHEDGSVHDTRILQSSGVSVLDEAAKEALRKSVIHSQIAKRVHVVLPIEYKLR